MRLRVTKEFHFEAAHFLPGYDGLCANLHGHSYKLFVTLRGEVLGNIRSPKDGMVIDFSLLKQVVEREVISLLDHTLVIRRGLSPIAEEVHFRLLELDNQPTSENLLLWIVERLRGALPASLELFSVRLYETASSSAEWCIED